MDSSTSVVSQKGKRSRRSAPRQEVRCAVRFPLMIPATLSMGKDERDATTRNVSASGVLFTVDKELLVGQDILFSLRMPGDVLGATHDVMVRCSGRVVRCSTSQDQYQAAATIDDYRFVEQ
ncbi:MAG TPA: PilZ domain-containing protein [Terracidiphilus sp.]|nr:PilZ domain-containing protein [Terracidiphilus sp.]